MSSNEFLSRAGPQPRAKRSHPLPMAANDSDSESWSSLEHLTIKQPANDNGSVSSGFSVSSNEQQHGVVHLPLLQDNVVAVAAAVIPRAISVMASDAASGNDDNTNDDDAMDLVHYDGSLACLQANAPLIKTSAVAKRKASPSQHPGHCKRRQQAHGKTASSCYSSSHSQSVEFVEQTENARYLHSYKESVGEERTNRQPVQGVTSRGELKRSGDDDVDLHHVQVGTSVYCKWKGTRGADRYYWGKVTKMTPHKNSFLVSVKFDDDDLRQKVPREDYDTAAYMCNTFSRDRLQYLGALRGLIERGLLSVYDELGVIATEPRKQGCGFCAFCTGEPCFCCHGCREGPRCFRKRMCQSIQPERKALEADGFPAGWGFAFHCEPEHAVDGPYIILLSPGGVRRYRTFEAAVRHNRKQLENVDVAAFYEYIGLKYEPPLDISRRTVHSGTTLAASLPQRQESPLRIPRTILGTSGTLCAEVGARSATSSDKTLKEVAARDVVDDELGIAGGAASEHSGPCDYRTHLTKLQHECCGICMMCVKAECGKCKGCMLNEDNVSSGMAVCLLKLCHLKQPEIPAPWEGWRFIVVPRKDDDKDDVPHPSLASLTIRFVAPKGKVYGWSTVPAFAKRRDASEKKNEFLHDFFGLAYLRKLEKHALLGKGFRREWLDADCRRRFVEGTITDCFADAGSDQLFTVRLDKNSVEMLSYMASDNCPTRAQLKKVGYQDALGGAALFHLQYPHTSAKVVGNEHAWCVPCDVRDKMSKNMLPIRVLWCFGWKLMFEVALSEIEGANLGCFVTCESASSATAHLTHMTIPPGVFIDIGVYARPEDCIPHERFLCKLFVHSQKAEYSFGKDDSDAHIFDINDNVRTSCLNAAARCNILPFINETDGIEAPCVIAQSDPAGMVHYLIGHIDDGVTLERCKRFEVKIDYGKSYEKIRIKNKYPRVRGEELARLVKEIEEEDYDFIANFGGATLADVAEYVLFLEIFWKEQIDRKISASQTALRRAVFVAILCLNRLQAFPNLAAESSSASAITTRTTMVLKELAGKLNQQYKEDMFGKRVFRKALRTSLGVQSSSEFLSYLDAVCSSQET